MAFFDKLNEVAKNIGDKTSDAIETNRLNSKINSERAAAGEELKKIGEFYYSKFAEAGENTEASEGTAAGAIVIAPEVLQFCRNAKAHYDAAAQAQTEIDRIKAENEAEKAAAAASAVPMAPSIPTGSAAPAVPVGGIVCPSCGTTNSEGTKFCQNCGNKLETPTPTEPVKRFCVACGTEVTPGVKFCPQCGQKME